MSQSEFDIIQHYFAESAAAFARDGVVLGIGDDAALLDIPDRQHLCISTDVLLADVHFPASADPELIANRALAVNLSDLAAMGAEPLCFTLGLSLPEISSHWLQPFSAGLVPLARQFNCPLIGGDLNRGPLSIAIQVHGLVPQGEAIRRDGASVGDAIYVTGTPGDGVLGLASLGLPTHLGEHVQIALDTLGADEMAYLHDAYYKPQPRIEFASACRGLVTAGIDISDGLLGDLGHITNRSGVGAQLVLSELPASALAVRHLTPQARYLAGLCGGDDYELCLTVAEQDRAALESLALSNALTLSHIGTIVDGGGVQCLDATGAEISVQGQSFQHFRMDG